MLGFLSLVLLGTVLYFVIWKRELPAFIHPLYRWQAKHFDRKDPKAELTDIIRIFHFAAGVVFLGAAYFGLQLFMYPASNTFFWPICLGLAGVVAYFFADKSRSTFVYYARAEPVIIEQGNIKTGLGAKDWADKIYTSTKIPPVAAPDGTPIGIHIGEGLHWYDKGHMLTVGGSGQGKGVCLILPAILSDGFVAGGISLVCLDPKGENAAVAAPFLKASGYDVHVINPFGIKEVAHLGNSRFNPFDQIDRDDDDATRLYDVLAMALHNRRGTGENSFFDNRCRQYISLYMAYAHHCNLGNFDTVYDWLTLSGDRRKDLLASMATDDTFDQAKAAQAISDRLTGEAAKTEESIFGTIEEAINILKIKRLRASLAASDFDMRTVAQKPTAIFLCVPFEDLDYYAPWVRMFFNFLLRTLTKHYNPDRKVLVLLDEFPQLSYMDEVPRSSAVLRGYNVTLWPVVQNLGQLKTIYGENWETFVGSSVIKHWLSSGADNTTAEYIEKRMPMAVRFLGQNSDGSPKYTEGKLLSADQAMGFEHMICEVAGMDRPAKFDKVRYMDLPFARHNAAENPFYKKR
jgi:type IV secretion system protein VirD4